MYHIVARLKHIQLLQRKRNFSASGLVTAQVVFMETVEYLMIGKNTAMQRMVDESFVQGTVYSCKLYFIASFTENINQTVGLFYTVRTNV